MEFIRILLIIILVIIFWKFDPKKYVNFNIIIDWFFMMSLLSLLVFVFVVLSLKIYINSMSPIFLFILLIIGVSICFFVIISWNSILGGFRTINYVIKKNYYRKKGIYKVGKIYKINTDMWYERKYVTNYYLVVKIGNEIIKSTYYTDKRKFRIGDEVAVIEYRGKYLIMID